MTDDRPELDLRRPDGGDAADSADEFDVEDPPTDRRGAHRARPGAVSRWGPTALVIATVTSVVVLVVGALVVVGPSGIASLASAGWARVSGSDDAADPAASPSETSSETPTDTGTETAPPSETATETSAPPPETATGTPTPEQTVDQGVPVVVLNGTTTTGLAGGAAAALEDAGWTVDRTDNYRDDEVPTTVFFSDPALAATAAALAADVAGTAEQSDLFDDPLTVVLGSDYTG